MGKNTSNQMVNPWHSKNSNGKSLAESVNEIINNSPVLSEATDEITSSKSKAKEWKRFTALLEDYTGVKGQGAAVWIPTEVKKRIEFVRANAKTNIPIRALAAAMIVAFIDEHRNELKTL